MVPQHERRQWWSTQSRLLRRVTRQGKVNRRFSTIMILVGLVLLLFVLMYIIRNWTRLRTSSEEYYWLQRRPPQWPYSIESVSFAKNPNEQEYRPAITERYIFEDARKWELDSVNHLDGTTEWRSACRIWKETMFSTGRQEEIIQEIRDYLQNLQSYYRNFDAFRSPISDVRNYFHPDHSNQHEVCNQVELGAKLGNQSMGLESIVTTLSALSHVSGEHYLEPLLPPLRHRSVCTGEPTDDNIKNLRFWIFDSGAACRSIRKRSRVVLFDISASADTIQETMLLVEFYRKFGLPVDYIHAFAGDQQVSQPYDKVPPELWPMLQWIPMSASVDPSSEWNPLKWIQSRYNKDDLVIIKMSGNSDLVVSLAQQILANTAIQELIDDVYLEIPVAMTEMVRWWKNSAKGGIMDALNLLALLRTKGINAHSWI